MGKRPLAVWAIALITGILVADNVPSVMPGICIVFLFCLALYLVYRRMQIRSPFILLAIPLMTAGFMLHCSNIRAVNNRFMPWQGRMVTVEGMVDDEPVFSDGRIVFTLSADIINDKGKATKVHNGKIRVRVYSESPMDELEYGRMVRIGAELEIPASRRNIGGFDYRRFLAARGISGICSVNPRQIEVLDESGGFFLKSAGYALRKGILDALYTNMPQDEASVAAGMLIGYTQEMPESMEESFRRAGLSHIMAVSGANLAFLLIPFIWLLRKIGLNPRWAAVISMPAMLVYVFATGMEASVMRAAIMAGIMLLGMIIWRQTDVYCSISASCIIILLSNSFMLFDTGFLLSYGATLSLVVFYKPILDRLPARIPKTIRETLAGTIAAQLGVIPVIACTFNSFSAVSVFANLAVVSVTGLLTSLAAALSVLWYVLRPACRVLGLIVTILTDIVLAVTDAVSSIPWAELTVATPGFLPAAGYYVILLIIRFGIPRLEGKTQRLQAAAENDAQTAVSMALNEAAAGHEGTARRNGKRRFGWLTACMLAAYGIIILLDTLPPGKLEIYFADVGQGDCTVIRTPAGRSIIIDGGGSIYDDESSYAGEMIVVPVLLDLKITGIDVMVATHGHADHINGLKSVMEKMDVKRLVVADAEDSEMNGLIDYAVSRGIPVERADQGDIIYAEKGLELKAVYPLDDKSLMPSGRTSNANELSLVTRLDYAGFSALFTGDIGFTAENLMLGQELLDCDLIKVPHHGSRYSSGEEFIRQVSPAVAVISVGENRYGQPSYEVEERYAASGARLYETIRHGGIMVSVDSRKPGQISVRTVVRE